MNLKSPYFDKIRISQPEPRAARGPLCAHPSCHLEGTHRAPKGRFKEGYFLFCFEHVQKYNQSYNAFHGMSDVELETYYKASLIGHRPTWERHMQPLWAQRSPAYDAKARDRSRETRLKPVRPHSAALALATLGLDVDANKEQIRMQYKILLKRFHPDSNGGDRSCEARLNAVIEAYKKLRVLKIV